jgi:hypothetical protein
MILETTAIATMLCALAPAVLFCVNLRGYRKPPASGAVPLPKLSVLIPARDEEKSIRAAVTSVLASTGISFEVLVLDDCSTDQTASIVEGIAASDDRLHLLQSPPLPAGWNGKQHACWVLAQAAQSDILCFVDADVRVSPEAFARSAAFLVRHDLPLVSGFPRQITRTWLEWMLLPLIHFVLLGFLPISRMRASADPAFAAGCGQFMMVRRETYFAAGGHAAIRHTMHDGLLLPKAFRQAGYRTDLIDLTQLATCRMYTNARQVWQGLAKNATEGLAAPVRILPISLLLFAGQVMPFLLAVWLLMQHITSAVIVAAVVAGVFGAWLPRVQAVRRFRQDWRSALLHPVGIAMLLVLQWYSLVRKILGGKVSWKERLYAGQ